MSESLHALVSKYAADREMIRVTGDYVHDTLWPQIYRQAVETTVLEPHALTVRFTAKGRELPPRYRRYLTLKIAEKQVGDRDQSNLFCNAFTCVLQLF